MPPLTVHVVSHTHWDREWYRTAGEFRLSLTDLVDEVLDLDVAPHFLLDGQAIVLEDYLAVRPKRADALRSALHAGRVEAGPWYVLGDNLIPGGEALIRNLLAGRALLAQLGAAPPAVLYCPDSFGHPAALPRIGHGFGATLCVVWRGYGGPPWPAGDSARWRDRDGSEILLYHLPPDGYETGANLPPDAAGARAAWERFRTILAPRATLGLALLPNGADHHAVQARRAEALRALAHAAAPHPVVDSTLHAFADALGTRAASYALPVVSGELRQSPAYVWSLQGTFGSRTRQKRDNAIVERLLLRHTEPLAALAWWHDGRSRRHLVQGLWRSLLRCHPHDTLCGCSIDAVARAMDQRLDEVQRAASVLAHRARRERLGDDPAAARARIAEWRPVVVVWNASPRTRSGIAELVVDEPLAHVAVGPGSGGGAPSSSKRRPLRLGDGSIVVQELSHEVRHAREESPRHYPRNELVRRRHVLAWMPATDAMGTHVVPLHAGRSRAAPLEHPVTCNDDVLENGLYRVSASAVDGLCIETAAGDRLRDVLSLEVVGDRGDLYTHAPIPGTRSTGRIVAHRVGRRGPLRATLLLTLHAALPARRLQSATGAAIRHRASTVRVDVEVQLDAGSPWVAFTIHGNNAARDCRIRLVLRTGIGQPSVVADAAFGEVDRGAGGNESATVPSAGELPVTTAPLHRYVTLSSASRGVTILSDGLAEYEADEDGAVAITLVRGVGELSRRDMMERPGHAGWPEATPEAQGVGPFEARLALVAHAPVSDAVRARLHDAAEDFLVPLEGETWRSAIDPPVHLPGLQLEGEGLAFEACKESEDGSSLVVRCTNRLARTAAGAWRLAGVREAWLARLDETPLGALAVHDGGVAFAAPPRATITILLRR